MNSNYQNHPNPTEINTQIPDKRCILLFVRAPEKGKVKTRLAKAIGEDAALKLYMSFVADELEMLRELFFDVIIFFYPHTARQTVENWLDNEFDFVAQSGKDLGQRMGNAFREVFSRGYGQALLIGSDLPDLSSSLILDAFDHLARRDCVIGPSEDGGYYLIGFHRNTYFQEIFTRIRWGTSEVFNHTVSCLKKKKISFHTLPEWRDIDNYNDLVKLKESLDKNSKAAKHTYSCIINLQDGFLLKPR